jgi:hypothetical protein
MSTNKKFGEGASRLFEYTLPQLRVVPSESVSLVDLQGGYQGAVRL